MPCYDTNFTKIIGNEVMEKELKNLYFCTCRFHKLDMRFVDPSKIKIQLQILMEYTFGEGAKVVLDLIMNTLHRYRYPDYILFDFLLSPLLPDDSTRRFFLSQLWKTLLSRPTNHPRNYGGRFCFMHGQNESLSFRLNRSF